MRVRLGLVAILVVGAAFGAHAASVDLPAPRLAFIVNSVDNSIASYRVDPDTGLLRHNGHLPLQTLPTGVAVHPRAPFVYACTTTTDSIAIFHIGDDDRLTELPGSPVKGVGRAPSDLAFSPDGRFLYVALRHGQALAAYTVNADTGAITSLPGSPYKTNQQRPRSLAVHPSGRFVYTVNEYSNSVSVFRVDAATGVLTQVKGSPFTTGDEGILNPAVLRIFDMPETAGGVPYTVTVHPSGRFLYVANRMGGSISQFRIDAATGALRPITGNPLTTGPRPYSVRAHPSGEFVYVTSFVDTAVWGYRVNRDTGALTVLPDAPYATRGEGPLSLTFSARGDTAYVANSESNSVAMFTVDATRGSLVLRDTIQTRSVPHALALYYGAPKASAPTVYYVLDAQAAQLHRYVVEDDMRSWRHTAAIATGAAPVAVGTDPWGRYVFVANRDGNSMSGYQFDARSGALNELSGSPYATGKTPSAVAVDHNGSYVYVTNEGSNTMSVFAIDRDRAVLRAVEGSPFATGKRPVSLFVDTAARYALVGNAGSNDISVFRYRTSDSPLVYEINRLGSPFAGVQQPTALVVDPHGKYLYAASAGNTSVSAYSVHFQSGVLSALPGVALDGSPNQMAIHPNGNRLYALHRGGPGVVSQLRLDGATGALREDLPPLRVGKGAERLLLAPSGRVAYVFYAHSRKISVLTVDGASGRLAVSAEVSLAHPVTAVAGTH